MEELFKLVELGDWKAVEAFPEGKPTRKIVENPFKRSALLVSGDRPKHLKKVFRRDADILIFNVEDGVAPERKPIARLLLRKFLTNVPFDGSKTVVIRINPLDSSYVWEDLFQLLPTVPHAVRLSKVESPEDVLVLDGIISAFEKSNDVEEGFIKIHLSIETGRAVEALPEILSASERVEAAYLGILDLFADLKLPQSLTSERIGYHVRERFVLTCRNLNVYPIAPAYQQYEDLEGFKKEAFEEKKIGFSGKMCISVRQVAVANEVFSPSKEEIERAKRIVKAYEEALKEGKGGITVDGLFVDQPIYRDALNVLRFS